MVKKKSWIVYRDMLCCSMYCFLHYCNNVWNNLTFFILSGLKIACSYQRTSTGLAKLLQGSMILWIWRRILLQVGFSFVLSFYEHHNLGFAVTGKVKSSLMYFCSALNNIDCRSTFTEIKRENKGDVADFLNYKTNSISAFKQLCGRQECHYLAQFSSKFVLI